MRAGGICNSKLKHKKQETWKNNSDLAEKSAKLRAYREW